jgi:hypothetical protein
MGHFKDGKEMDFKPYAKRLMELTSSIPHRLEVSIEAGENLENVVHATYILLGKLVKLVNNDVEIPPDDIY